MSVKYLFHKVSHFIQVAQPPPAALHAEREPCLCRGWPLPRRRLGYDPSAFAPAFRTEVDYIVGRLYDIEVVFDRYHRVSPVGYFFDYAEQYANVLKMKAGGRFVENEERFPGVFLASSVASFTRWFSPR